MESEILVKVAEGGNPALILSALVLIIVVEPLTVFLISKICKRINKRDKPKAVLLVSALMGALTISGASYLNDINIIDLPERGPEILGIIALGASRSASNGRDVVKGVKENLKERTNANKRD